MPPHTVASEFTVPPTETGFTVNETIFDKAVTQPAIPVISTL